MKTPDDNILDRLFREGLNNPDSNAAFRKEDWEAMKELLDEKPRKKKGIVWFYWFSGSVAAILLLFFGWELLKPVGLIKNNMAKVSARKKASTENLKNKVGLQEKNLKKFPDKATGSAELAVSKKKIYADKNSIKESNQPVGKTNVATNKTLFSSNNQPNKNNSVNQATEVPLKNLNNIGTNNLAVNEASSTQKQTTVLPGNHTDTTSQFYGYKRSINLKATELTASQAKNIFADNTTHLTIMPIATKLLANNKVVAKAKNPVKTSFKMPARFSLAILSAPDVNGVSSFTGSKIGTNVGLQLFVQLTKRWSIDAGGVYAVKPYKINAQQYQTAATFWGKPGEVTADCKVLDIPINLNYQIFSKNRNSFAAGAGLSSYFMLRENYNFNYTDNTSYSRNIVNQNKHILGVLNLDATYQRQVNPSFNLIVQPYLKLPLTPIGYERINLQSAGIAIGVGWNIRSFKNK